WLIKAAADYRGAFTYAYRFLKFTGGRGAKAPPAIAGLDSPGGAQCGGPHSSSAPARLDPLLKLRCLVPGVAVQRGDAQPLAWETLFHKGNHALQGLPVGAFFVHGLH